MLNATDFYTMAQEAFPGAETEVLNTAMRAIARAYDRGRRDSAWDSYAALHKSGCPHGCGSCANYERKIHEHTIVRQESQ